jgi:hypothetical protein
MRVIGAFVDKVVGELVAEWTAELGGVEFGGAAVAAVDHTITIALR